MLSKSITTPCGGGVGVGVGAGAGTSNSTSSTAHELTATLGEEKLTTARLMLAFGSATSNGMLIGCGLGLGSSVAAACPICEPLESRARKTTVWLVLSGLE